MCARCVEQQQQYSVCARCVEQQQQQQYSAKLAHIGGQIPTTPEGGLRVHMEHALSCRVQASWSLQPLALCRLIQENVQRALSVEKLYISRTVV